MSLQRFESFLRTTGISNAETAARALNVSVNAIARYAKQSPNVAKLGAARATRYALRSLILGEASAQPLFWVDSLGAAQPLATLTHLTGGRNHIGTQGWDALSARNALPWFLAPAVHAGFLGRAVAQRFASPPANFDSNPERWSADQHLFVALQAGIDLPGAILIGERALETWHAITPSILSADDYDAHIAHAHLHLHAGTSAGGEQPKFTAVRSDGTHLLVKYSPPRGTPFGERWHDLLSMEFHASETLREANLPAAQSALITHPARTYLESARIDRQALRGRKHAVALAAIHDAFISEPRKSWKHTARALATQRCLSHADAAAIALVQRFGNWIGNNDMHFGNLSLIASTPDAVNTGHFTLAPVYDMLPMRYRPDATAGSLDTLPFTPTIGIPGEEKIETLARALAQRFWLRVRAAEVSAEARALANEMHARCG